MAGDQISPAQPRGRREGSPAVAFVFVLPLVAQDKQDWATPAEKADYRTTPNYDETMAYVRRITAAAPKQTKLVSFGKTGEGRDLWAVKISDNVGTDESEPEVLFEANIHAREHLTTEMALYIAHLLVDSYGSPTATGDLQFFHDSFYKDLPNPSFEQICSGSCHTYDNVAHGNGQSGPNAAEGWSAIEFGRHSVTLDA